MKDGGNTWYNYDVLDFKYRTGHKHQKLRAQDREELEQSRLTSPVAASQSSEGGIGISAKRSEV